MKRKADVERFTKPSILTATQTRCPPGVRGDPISFSVRIVSRIAGLALIFAMGFAPTAAAQSVEERRTAARLELQIAIATEARIAADLEIYRASPGASPDRIRAYEAYLDRVQKLTEEKRRALERLEKKTGSSPAGRPSPSGSGRSNDTAITEEQEIDALQALNQELDRSISEFDDMLLREYEQAQAAAEHRMRQLALEAAEAARSARGGDGPAEGSGGEGEAADGSPEELGGDRDSRGTGSGRGIEGEDEEGMEVRGTASRRDQASSGGGSGPSGGDDGASPVAQDDDIVARQLREAAEKETDPVLKEKLWKEYYDYKKGL